MSQSTSMYKQWWIDRLERNREYFEDAVEIESDWEASSQSEQLLISALRAAYARASDAIIHKFASAAVTAVDRAISEGSFEKGKLAQSAFPRNRAAALRARAYAKVLIGESLPSGDLLQASCDFEGRAILMWNHQYEAYYLNAVRAALIAGNQERFVALLNTKRKFKSHDEEYMALLSIADELSRASTRPSTDVRDRFRALFDRYRNPVLKPDIYIELEIARFEVGAIWCQVFEPSRPFSWQDVINAVST